MALCHITGVFYMPNGEPAKARHVVFVREPDNQVTSGYLGAISPDPIRVRTDVDGSISIKLITGNYYGEVSGATGKTQYKFRATVPDAATADIADVLIISEKPVEVPAWLQQAFEARDEAREWSDTAEGWSDQAEAAADRAEIFGARTFDDVAAFTADTALTTSNTPANTPIHTPDGGDLIRVPSGGINSNSAGVLVKQAKGSVDLAAFRRSGQDWREAFQNALDNADDGTEVVLDPREDYIIDSAIEASRSLSLDARGAELSLSSGAGRVGLISVVYPYSAATPVSSIDVVQIDFGGGNSPCHRLTVASGSPILSAAKIGDAVKIIEDQLIPWSIDADKERLGEHAIVAAVNSNSIDLVGLLDMPFLVSGQNTRIALMSKNSVSIKNLKQTIEETTAQRDAPLMYLEGVFNPVVRGVKSMDLRSPSIELLSCYMSDIDVTAINSITDDSRNEFGYGVAAYGSTGGKYTVLARGVRHGWTSGARGVDAINSPDISRYGGSLREYVHVNAERCYGPAIDEHADAFKTVMRGSVRQSLPGDNTSNTCVQIRGRQADCDVVTDGVRAVRVQMYGSGEGEHNITIRHVRDKQFGINIAAASIIGSTTNPNGTVKINAMQIDAVSGDMTAPAIEFSRVDAVVTSFASKFNCSGAGTVRPRLFDVTNGSNVIVQDYFADFSDRTTGGNNPALARVDGTSSLRIMSGRGIIGSGSVVTFDMMSGAGVAYVKSDFDVAPAEPVSAATATVSTDYSINGVRRREATTYRQGGGQTVTLTANSTRNQVTLTSLSEARTITLPTTALSNGQQFEFFRGAASTGAFPWNIGSITTLDGPSTSALIEWDGSNWQLLRKI